MFTWILLGAILHRIEFKFLPQKTQIQQPGVIPIKG